MYKFEGPETIKIKKVTRAGYFNIGSYAKSVTTLGCELGTKGYKNGLTEEQERYYENSLGLKPKELDRHSKWWGEVFNVTHSLRLFNTKTTTYILDNDINQIKYFVLMASSKVANSEIEKTPDSIFYIDNEEAKAKAENEVFNYEYEAMSLVLKLTPEEKRTSLRLFGKTGLDNSTETKLNNSLMQEMKKDPKAFVEILNDKNANTKAFINELVEKNIIKRKGNYYIHNEDTIAHSTEECIEYFNSKANQSVKLILESRLNKSKKTKEVAD